MEFGAEKVVTLFEKKAADEFDFDEDDGFSILSEEEMRAQDEEDSKETPNKSKEKQKKPTSTKKAPEDWSIGDEWFITKPKSATGQIDDSEALRLGKDMDLIRGRSRWGRAFRVWVDDKKIKDENTRLISQPKRPAPNQAFYDVTTGVLYFPEGSAGKSFRVEYYVKGDKGAFEFQDADEEYDSIMSLKRRSQSLWENLLNHPDPDFVRTELIPVIEDELEHLRDNDEDVPDLTGEFMTLEQLLYRLDDDDATYSKDESIIDLEDPFLELADLGLPDGAELRSISYADSGKAFRPTEDDPDEGEFLREGDALLFNEEDVGHQLKVEYNKPSNAKELVVRYIKENIAPKLEGLHALSHLLAEKVLSFQGNDDDDLEGLPGMEDGKARSLDPHSLRYVQRVLGESEKLEKDLTDFAKFHMPRMAQLIRWASSYYPNRQPPRNEEEAKKDTAAFNSSIKPRLEEAGITMPDLLQVALDTFRQGILEWDYSKRKDQSVEAKKFRVISNPKIWRNVRTALQSVFNAAQTESYSVEKGSEKETITIPDSGGVVPVGKRNMVPESVVVINPVTKTEFQAAGGHIFSADGKRGNRFYIDLNGHTANGKVSPFKGKTFRNYGKQGIRLVSLDGEEFKRVFTLDEVKNTSDEVFYVTISQHKKISVPAKYQGELFNVIVQGVDSNEALGKNEFEVLQGGKIRFSPANGGEEVLVQWNTRTKTRRHVKPTMTTDSGEAMDFLDAVEDEDAGAEKEISRSQTEDTTLRFLDEVEWILSDPDETRLSLEEKTLLEGILGLNPEQKRLTIREIVQDPPFDLDPDKQASEVTRIRTKMQPEAASKLIEILKEKLKGSPELQAIMKSRAFNHALFEGDRATDRDKFASYLEKKFKEGDEDPTKGFRAFLGDVLSTAGLQEDEENILRWRWSIQGPLRRSDGDDEGKTPDLLGGAPTPMDVIIAEEFLPDEELQVGDYQLKQNIAKMRPFVEKVYDRALKKFEKAFGVAVRERKDQLKGRPWVKDFLKYYSQQRDRENLREMLVRDEDVSSPAPVERKEPPRIPLFDQVIQSGQVEDGDLLRDLLKELDKNQKLGKDLNFMIEERKKSAEDLSTQQLQTSQDLIESFSEAKENLSEVQRDLKAHSQLKTELFQKMIEEAGTLEAFEAAKKEKVEATTPEDEKAAKKKLRGLLQEARGKASPETRKDFANIIKEEKSLQKDLEDLKELIQKQRKAIEDGYKRIPALQAQKELEALQGLREFFTYNDEYDLGGGKFNLANLFSVSKKAPSPGYTPPQGEVGEDDYRPAPAKLHVPPRTKTPEPLEPPAPPARQLSPAKKKQIRKLEENYADGLITKKELEDQKFLIENEETPKSDEGKTQREQRELERPRFTPRKPSPVEKSRSLYDLLLSYALPIPGDQDQKEREENVKKFRALMEKMREYVSGVSAREEISETNPETGRVKVRRPAREAKPPQGTVEDFIADPGIPKRDMLVEQPKVLARIKEYLENNATDLQIGDGNWDLSKLFVPRKIEDQDAKIDKTPEDESVEALANTQDLTEDQARLLHSFIKVMSKGVPLSKILQGLKKSKSVEKGGALELAGRLLLYVKLHPEVRDGQKYNFDKLYTGEDRLPSGRAYDRARPLSQQIAPLVDALYKEKVSEAGPGQEPESKKQIQAKIEDLLERMGEMVSEDFDLNEMADHFLELDEGGETPYSLSYLFQRVRNYLRRLNRTSGIQNMTHNYGLDALFPDGPPLEDPADQDETTPVPEAESETVKEMQGDVTAKFMDLVEEQGLSNDEAQKALQILQSIQLRIEDSGKTIVEIIQPLLKREALAPVIKKILKYIRDHKDEIQSGIPGVPDFSRLTGIPFSPPDVSEEEQEAQEAEEAVEVPAPAATPTPASTPDPEEGVAPADDEPSPDDKPLRESIQNTIRKLQNDSPKRRIQRIRALVEHELMDKADVYTAIMNSGLPPAEIFKLRSLFNFDEEEGMSLDMPTPKDHGMIEPEVPRAPKAKPKAAPPAKGKRGRLSKELSGLQLDEQEAFDLNERIKDGLGAEQANLLDEFLEGWDDALSYDELIGVANAAAKHLKDRKDIPRGLKKAWDQTKSAWRLHLQSREAPAPAVPEQQVPAATPEVKKQAPPAQPSAQQGPGKDAVRSAILGLSEEDRGTFIQTFMKLRESEGLTDIGDATQDDWERWTTLVDPKQAAVLKQLIGTIFPQAAPTPKPKAKKKSKKAPKPKAAPTPQAPKPTPPVVDPQKLMEFAIRTIRDRGVTPEQFGENIAKNHPHLVPIYQQILPEIHKALAPQEPDLFADVDFSELYD